MSAELIAAIAEQERMLVLPRFGEGIAFSLGSAIRERAVAAQAPVIIEIKTPLRRFFFTALPGSSADNEDWARRKMNAVLRTGKSSMRLGLELAARGRSQMPEMNLPHESYALHGGGFPLAVTGAGLIGAIGVSGLPSLEDHRLITDTLAAHLGREPVPLPEG